MIILNSTDKIQIKLSRNIVLNPLECYVSYRDTTSSTITPSRNFITISGTSAVDLVGSPASSTQRVVDYLSIHNPDISANTVTVQFDVSSTPYELTVTSLQIGEKLEYQEGVGFKSIDDYGALKTGNKLGYNNIAGLSSVTINSDVVNSNAVANTIADITGLSFSVTSGATYWFRFVIPFTSAASTTGSRFSISGASTSALYFQSQYPSSITAQATNVGLSAFDTPAAATTTSPTTLVGLAIIEGVATFSANGTLIGRFSSEVANSAITVKAGATVYYKQLNP